MRPMLFELDAAALLDAPLPAFKPLPRQQPVWRDMAMIVRRAGDARGR